MRILFPHLWILKKCQHKILCALKHLNQDNNLLIHLVHILFIYLWILFPSPSSISFLFESIYLVYDNVPSFESKIRNRVGKLNWTKWWQNLGTKEWEKKNRWNKCRKFKLNFPTRYQIIEFSSLFSKSYKFFPPFWLFI